MGADDDLARLLPEPPPPRPGRRGSAIAAAIRRFDGDAAPVPTTAADRAQAPRPTWWRMPTAQFGALASVLLVALIGISVVVHAPDGQSGRPGEGRGAVVIAPPVSPQAIASGPPAPCATGKCATDTRGPTAIVEPPAATGSIARLDAPSPAPAAEVEKTARPADAMPQVRSPAAPVMAAPPPPPPPPPPETTAASRASAVSAFAPPPVTAGRVADSGVGDVVVTGSRLVRARSTGQREDWNACTVDDPRRSLRACMRWIGGDADGPGVALSEGLSLAWETNWDGAVTAFSRAIVLKRRFGFAYLNRGLAYRHAGDLVRAAADLDLAIRYEPVARNYYNRAVVRRERGDARGARADAGRAVELDSSYPDATE